MNTLGDIAGVVGVVLAIGGIVAAWVFYQRGKRERRPIYGVTGNRVVKGNPKRGIEVTFRGENVPMVSRTLVSVWNEGRETIRRSDVTEPLAICVDEGARILEASLAAATRPAISFQVEVDPPRTVVLSFDHLDHRDGATIEILHTAPDPANVDFTGNVIGTQGRIEKVESLLWDVPGGFRSGVLMAAAGFVFALSEALHQDWGVAAIAGGVGLSGVWTAFESQQAERRRLPVALWRDVPGGLPFAAPRRRSSTSLKK